MSGEAPAAVAWCPVEGIASPIEVVDYRGATDGQTLRLRVSFMADRTGGDWSDHARHLRIRIGALHALIVDAEPYGHLHHRTFGPKLAPPCEGAHVPMLRIERSPLFASYNVVPLQHLVLLTGHFIVNLLCGTAIEARWSDMADAEPGQ